MKTMRSAALALSLLMASAALSHVLACGCELICPEGEEYSDETERCEPKDNPVS